MRDLIGLLLIVTGFAKLLLGYYLVRSERVKTGLWLDWPLSRGIRLAGSFSSTGIIFGLLGVLIMGGTSILPWWAIGLVLNVTFWVGLLWIDWARAPVVEAAPPAPDRPWDEIGVRDAD